ncbi:response regulator [Mycobacterium aquaticum]|uniref:Regulator n=1 Tax=Mycobacterium aquaticum TaxID=1927124 RepID=A0A1X0BCB8_9MYCO|nr:response regulator [Mycobacterium aquaticum]ORA40001.1 regulator [Mycobacterium aquaticum]
MAHIAIVDDHLLVRDALAHAMRDVGHDVTAARTLAEFVADPSIELILLDLDLGAAGLADAGFVTEMRARGIPVLIVSALGSARHVRRMLQAGAVGVVAKTDSVADLSDAVDAALRGEQWMSPMLAQAIAVDNVDRPKLSDQELLALRLYACGLKLDSVARRMGVASSTAKQYIDRVRDKYAQGGHQVRTKAELYAMAVQDGFISRESDADAQP